MPNLLHTTSGTLLSYLAILAIAGCSDSESMNAAVPKDPTTAEKVSVDRFTDQAAMLQRRSAAATLPGPNQAVDFDQELDAADVGVEDEERGLRGQVLANEGFDGGQQRFVAQVDLQQALGAQPRRDARREARCTL